MKRAEKDVYNKDELGENSSKGKNKKIGLSTPEAEEAGDFAGDGKINTNKHIPDGKGSAGSTQYRMSTRKTDTGTTGTNAKKDRNSENRIGDKKDKEPGFRQDDGIS
jgi:hypothetical protein